MPDSSLPEDPKPIGKAGSPFDTNEIRPLRVPSPPIPTSSSEGYDLDAPSLPEEDEPPRPVPIPSPIPDRPKAKAKPKARVEPLATEESGSTEFVTEVSDVDPVWTRMGEWGPDLGRVVGTGMGTLVLSWLFGFGTLGFLIFLLGGAATVLLSYPLLITLERPVRITPEQAVVDFYAAASHHFPSYRRMWLLLSDLGRTSGKFATFEAFRDYWKGQIESWKQAGGGGNFTPLRFEVDAFRSDKSTGKETSRAEYNINVYVRGHEKGGPIESFRMVHGLVKGPDRMWYLNRGFLKSPTK